MSKAYVIVTETHVTALVMQVDESSGLTEELGIHASLDRAVVSRHVEVVAVEGSGYALKVIGADPSRGHTRPVIVCEAKGTNTTLTRETVEAFRSAAAAVGLSVVDEWDGEGCQSGSFAVRPAPRKEQIVEIERALTSLRPKVPDSVLERFREIESKLRSFLGSPLLRLTEHERMVLEAVKEAGGEETTESLYDIVFDVAPGDDGDPYENAREVVGALERAGYLDHDESTHAAMGRSVLTEAGRTALAREET